MLNSSRIVSLVCLLAFGGWHLRAEPPPLVTDSELEDVTGQKVGWQDGPRFRVWAFLGCECPVARLYGVRLQEMADAFEKNVASQGAIQWVGVISNSHDSPDDIRAFAKDTGIRFPLMKDADQSLAKTWHATRTAEVVVVDRQGLIHYRGRIDDQYAPGVKRSKSLHCELHDALGALLEGRDPAVTVTEPTGCLITWDQEQVADATITFAKEVAPVLYRHCAECHRAGEIGPFDITDFKEVRGWAEMILEVIDSGRMPPWHADPDHGSFKNTRSMSRDEIALIRNWVRAGAPMGRAEDLPAPPAIATGWRLQRDPDCIVSMRNTPYRIPATGTVEYQYFVVDPKFTEDRWVSGAQVIPGDPAVVHHAIVFIRPPDNVDFSGTGWLTAYVPGQTATGFPEGYARRVPAGSKLVFQMHYTPNGRETTDLSKIGMTFVEESHVTHEVFTLAGLDQDFEIPPGVADHRVEGKLNRLPSNGELLAVSPHMHLRGKSFELRSHDAVGSKILLRVPRYDFNWQHTYEFSERIPFKALERLDFTVSFDNSRDNPFNPDPDEYVMWGDQTWEEMALAFFEVAVPRAPEESRNSGEPPSASVSRSAEPSAKAVTYADEFIQSMDRDGDGKVSREEATTVVRDYSFQRLDRDQDRFITREELIQAVDERRGR
ncbi:MAG: redoxin domain-containing protein [Planctomycetota bacterium]|jgi:mono/diheme cytochrome c family protein